MAKEDNRVASLDLEPLPLISDERFGKCPVSMSHITQKKYS